MSEGLGGSPSSGAAPSNGASNGASSTQSPAPGTTSTPVTPKNGEGAVVAAPKPGSPSGTPTPPKAAFTPLKRTLKFGDGTTKEVLIDSEEALDRYLMNANSFDRTHKERLRLQKEREELTKALAEDKFDEALKALGKNPEEYHRRWAEEEYKRLNMTAEQRQQAEWQAEQQRMKQELELYKQKEAQRLQEEQEQREWAARAPQYKQALQSLDLAAIAENPNELSDDFTEELARQAERFRQAGMPWTPQHEVAAAYESLLNGKIGWGNNLPPERFFGVFGQQFKRLAPEHAPLLLQSIPEATLKAVIQAKVDELKKVRGVPVVETPQPQPTEPKKEEYGGLSEREWLKKLRGI